MKMKIFCYLVERIADGKKFISYGNPKISCYGSSYLFELVAEDYPYAYSCCYGYRRNISSDFHYNSKEYRIIHQMIL